MNNNIREQERLIKQNEAAAYRYMEERKSQMTREEAEKLARKCGNDYPWYEGEIKLLEALGLIKFDTQKETVEELLRRCGYNSADRILMILSDNGYDVVKREKDASS